jgi:uncharacterized membrane protein YphA (DoxX/SURF4 family)
MENKLSTIKTGFFFFVRIVIGLFFVYSGVSKLIRPIEYFEYAIGQYKVFPDVLISLSGFLVPWIETICGAYLLLGLWTYISGLTLFCLTVCFQLILSQALLRRIPIDDCGCFGGNFIHFNLYQSLILDTVLALILINIATLSKHVLSVDNYFKNQNNV